MMGSTAKVSQVPEGLNQELAITFTVGDWKDILRYLRADFRTPDHILKAIEANLKDCED